MKNISIRTSVVADGVPSDVKFWSLFQEASSTIIYNKNGSNGAVNGTVTYPQGLNGKCLSIAASNSNYISLGSSLALDYTALTVCAWINANSLVGGCCPLGRGYVTRFAINADGSGHFIVMTKNVAWYDASSYVVWSAGAITTGKWYRLVGAYDGSNVRLYINGTLIGTSSSITGTVGTSNSGQLTAYPIFCLGGDRGGGGTTELPYNGSLSDVRVYNRAWTQNEVAIDYFSKGKSICG